MPYVWRGMAEGGQNELDKADADFHAALKLDPKNAAAYLELAQLRLIQKKIPEAQTLLEQALLYNPNGSRALRLLAATFVIEKQTPKAISRVQDQIAKSPQNNEMYDVLADLQLSSGDSSGALASAQRPCSSSRTTTQL